MTHILLFHLELDLDRKIAPGRLLLISKDNNTIQNIYSATSGIPGYQTRTNLSSLGKGCIPPHNEVGLQHYTVDTKPIYMPKVKGVEGNFYKINPHLVNINNVQRGDFGIHFDANVPGSAGCIVCRTTIGWTAFEEDMKRFNSNGIESLPLLISYTTD